jgi:Ni,Fe-hydrogenase III small subunit
MLEFIRAFLAAPSSRKRYPRYAPELPARFRGRPAIEIRHAENGFKRALPVVPTDALRARSDGLPVIDLGSCLFSPEEAVDDGDLLVRYTQEISMSSRTRKGLETVSGVIDPVPAFERKMRSLLGRSLRLRSVVAGSCGGCESELNALGNVVFEMSRFGIQFVASPRHADGLVITGVVNANMLDALQRTYEAVPDPRIVIAVGACAASGGPFKRSPEVVGIPDSIPVDLWIPGCPPHPLTVLDGLLRLIGRLAR